MFADEYFLFPIVALGLIGGMILLLRWAFSRPRGGSLVRRTDNAPADRDTFGLLVDVKTTSTYNEARVSVSMLKDLGIRATAARTKEGWSVYVWPADETSARGFLDAS